MSLPEAGIGEVVAEAVVAGHHWARAGNPGPLAAEGARARAWRPPSGGSSVRPRT